MSKNPKDWKKVKEDSELLEEALQSAQEDELARPANLNSPSYEELEERLALAEQRAKDNLDKALRATAEAENARRRAEMDIANAHRFGLQDLINGFLPVVDSLEQALQLVDPETQQAMYEGLQLTLKLFKDALEKQGVKELNPAGELFNPQEHEAMAIQELKDVVPNSVLTVFQKGYKLNDRVIRPARVIVAKGN